MNNCVFAETVLQELTNLPDEILSIQVSFGAFSLAQIHDVAKFPTAFNYFGHFWDSKKARLFYHILRATPISFHLACSSVFLLPFSPFLIDHQSPITCCLLSCSARSLAPSISRFLFFSALLARVIS